jgi:AraC-like DNA-binding protein
MKDRPSPPRLPLRALYTISELARATGMSRRYLRRALEERGVTLFVVAGRPWVPLSEIKAKLGTLWDSTMASGSVEDEGDASDAEGPETDWGE